MTNVISNTEKNLPVIELGNALKLIPFESLNQKISTIFDDLSIPAKHNRKIEVTARLMGYPSQNHRAGSEAKADNDSNVIQLFCTDFYNESGVDFSDLEVSTAVLTISKTEVEKLSQYADMMKLIGADSIGVSAGYIEYYDSMIDEDEENSISEWIEKEDTSRIACEETVISMSFCMETKQMEPAVFYKGSEKYGLPFSVEKIFIKDLQKAFLDKNTSINKWTIIDKKELMTVSVSVNSVDFDIDDGDQPKINMPIIMSISDIEDMEDLDELVSDEISNITGFCHKGFTYEII